MKAINLLLIFTAFHISSLYGQEVKLDLIPLSIDYRIGLVDFDGNEKVPFIYDDFKWSDDLIFAVKYGAEIIDDYGHKRGGKWGFIDENGKKLIPFEYDDAFCFSEGLATVKKNGKYGFINLKNETVINFKFDLASPFREGLAMVQSDGKWGIIDKEENEIIPYQDNFLEPLNYGFYKVQKQIEPEGLCGMINSKEDSILRMEYERIGDFENGLAYVNYNGAYGYINQKGEVVIPFDYEYANDFSEGFALVSKYVYKEHLYTKMDSLENKLDELRKVISEEEIERLEIYKIHAELQKINGYPKKKPQYGYIDKKGKPLTDFVFDSAEPFERGIAKISFSKDDSEVDHEAIAKKLKEGKRLDYNDYWEGDNLIDTLGNVLLKENQLSLRRYDDGTIVNTIESGVGALDSNLNQIIPNQYLELTYIGDGLFFAKGKDGKTKKIIDSKNKTLIEDEKFSNFLKDKNRFIVEYIVGYENSKEIYKMGLMDMKGNWIVRPKFDTLEYFYHP